MDTENNNTRKQKAKYTVRNPYYEDRDSYNLNACISERRKPNFGYPLPDLDDTEKSGKRSKSNEVVERQGVDF